MEGVYMVSLPVYTPDLLHIIRSGAVLSNKYRWLHYQTILKHTGINARDTKQTAGGGVTRDRGAHPLPGGSPVTRGSPMDRGFTRDPGVHP